jgi:hypothetical protein
MFYPQPLKVSVMLDPREPDMVRTPLPAPHSYEN